LIVITDAPIVSRFDQLSHVKDRRAVAAFGPFMDDLRRAILTPTQRTVLELIAEDSLLRGFFSVCYPTLEALVLDDPGQSARANLSANDISPALKHVSGMGILRADWFVTNNGRALYVILLPDSSTWSVGWRCAASRRAARWDYLDEVRRADAPFLKGLAPDADLYDALATVVVRAAPANDRSNAPILPSGEPLAGSVPLGATNVPEDHSASRKGSLPVDKPNAPRVSYSKTERCHASRRAMRSDFQNAERPIGKAFSRCHSESQNHPLRLKDKDPKELKINLKSWRAFSIEQKKNALADLEATTSFDEVCRCLEIILGEDVARRESGKWINARKRFPIEFQSVMVIMVEDMSAGIVDHAGRKAHFYGRQHGIFKESLVNH
jgi:hypothetical protein